MKERTFFLRPQEEKAMKNTDLDTIFGALAEMRLIAEGAVSIYEKAGQGDAEAYSLIGEALYMIRDRITECLETRRE